MESTEILLVAGISQSISLLAFTFSNLQKYSKSEKKEMNVYHMESIFPLFVKCHLLLQRCYDTHLEKERSLHMKIYHQGKKLLLAQVSVLQTAVHNISIIFF